MAQNNNDIKPIEEIKNGGDQPSEKPVAQPSVPPAAPSPSKSADQQPPAGAPTSAPVPPPSAGCPPPASYQPTTPSEPGKKAIIKRTGGEGWIKYLLLGLVALLIASGAFYYFFYRVTFEINPSPAPDRILLDSREVKPGIYRVKPGVHTVVIEKKGFVSYISSKKYSFGEKVKLNFNFAAQKSPTISAQGGRLSQFGSDKNHLFFLGSDNTISIIDLGDQSGKITSLSNAEYPSARSLKISKDQRFAMIMDEESVKIVNFIKTDLINQPEIKLPPLVSAIETLTWNNNESQYFPEANSKILYDLKTPSGWDIYLANLAHSQADIIMQIDPNVFPKINLDWGDSPNQVLVTGGELGVLDIPKRDYKKISSQKNFIWGKWGPGGEKAIAVDSEGDVWSYRNGSLEKLPFSSGANLVDFIDNQNIAAVSQGRPIKYNFDTRELNSYAEVKDLSQSISFISKSDVFYFETAKGIFSGRYEKADYGLSQQDQNQGGAD